MDYENNPKKFESVYSQKVRAGKRRTYFFDVRKTKGDDYYLTLTESTKKIPGDGYERHKIFLYKEDFNRFLAALTDAVDHVKTELLPDYDYDEYTRRQEEWEAKRAAMIASGEMTPDGRYTDKAPDHLKNNTSSSSSSSETVKQPDADAADTKSDDDMSW